ncbi:hypothetical protein HMPREF9171_1354 [Streptococcus agalactiae ATCC 13813]|nr:hypothetical protein HMPREF9171_1354 [Streptococcus agalactiae ATCC 13813]
MPFINFHIVLFPLIYQKITIMHYIIFQSKVKGRIAIILPLLILT